MKQVGLGLHNYHDTYGSFPAGYEAQGIAPGAPASDEDGRGFAWGAKVLQFIEQGNAYDQIEFRQDCRDTQNMLVGATPLEVFRCPSDVGDDTFQVDSGGTTFTLATANYVGILGYGSATMGAGNPMGPGVFYRNSAVKMADITDGTSNTICVGERASIHRFVNGMPEVESQATWYAAVPKVMRPAGMGMMMPSMMEGPGSLVLGHVGQPAMMSMMAMHHPPKTTNHIVNFSSFHPGGIHFVGCDGSVHFLSETVDYDTFRRLGQRNDGEVVGDSSRVVLHRNGFRDLLHHSYAPALSRVPGRSQWLTVLQAAFFQIACSSVRSHLHHDRNSFTRRYDSHSFSHLCGYG